MGFKSFLVLLTTIAAVQGITCPNYFDPVGENCYYFSEDYADAKSWDNARSYCQSLDSDLAVFGIDCADTDRLIKHIIREDYTRMWVGASDEAQENFWVWIDGRPVDMKSKLWYYNEPDSGSSYDCALLEPSSSPHSRATLYDSSCSSSYYYVCEYGIHSA